MAAGGPFSHRRHPRFFQIPFQQKIAADKEKAGTDRGDAMEFLSEAKQKQLIVNVWALIKAFDRTVEERTEFLFMKAITTLKYAFIAVMILYLAVCILSLSHKIVSFTLAQGALDFASIKTILTDGLFTLIVIAIVKTFLIRNSFDYALTLLEIGFVVIIRKLILLDTVAEETNLMLVLGFTSALFFILIVYIHNLKRRWKREEAAC